MKLLKIGEVATQSGVSIPTLKHYLREGLIEPSRRTGRTMAWYAPAVVGRVRAIRELQSRQFLPLEVIKKTLDEQPEGGDELQAMTAIAAVLSRYRGARSTTRAELIDRGVDPRALDWLAATKLAVPTGDEQRYGEDDLALLSTLGAARRAGITPEMLPFAILGEYLRALHNLVDVELRMFRSGVIANADPSSIHHLTTVATELSERLVVLLRRKLLLPTLTSLSEAKRHDTEAATRRADSDRVQHAPRPRRRRRAARSARR